MRRTIGLLGGMALAAVAAAPVAAQSRDDLLKCALVIEDAERLACYDRLMASASAEVRALEAKRKLAAEEAARKRAEAEAAKKRESFGAEQMETARTADESRLDELESTVAEVFTDGLGRKVLALANGQIWRQVEGNMSGTVRPGDPVRIKRGAMGGFRLTLVRHGRALQVRRIR